MPYEITVSWWVHTLLPSDSRWYQVFWSLIHCGFVLVLSPPVQWYLMLNKTQRGIVVCYWLSTIAIGMLYIIIMMQVMFILTPPQHHHHHHNHHHHHHHCFSKVERGVYCLSFPCGQNRVRSVSCIFNLNNTYQIQFIFAHLIKQLQKGAVWVSMRLRGTPSEHRCSICSSTVCFILFIFIICYAFLVIFGICKWYSFMWAWE